MTAISPNTFAQMTFFLTPKIGKDGKRIHRLKPLIDLTQVDIPDWNFMFEVPTKMTSTYKRTTTLLNIAVEIKRWDCAEWLLIDKNLIGQYSPQLIMQHVDLIGHRIDLDGDRGYNPRFPALGEVAKMPFDGLQRIAQHLWNHSPKGNTHKGICLLLIAWARYRFSGTLTEVEQLLKIGNDQFSYRQLNLLLERHTAKNTSEQSKGLRDIKGLLRPFETKQTLDKVLPRAGKSDKSMRL